MLPRPASAALLAWLLADLPPALAADLDAAEHWLRTGNLTEASRALRVLPKAPAAIRYRTLMLQAQLALAQGNASRAGLLYEQAATQFGERPAAEIGQIRAYLQAGEYRKALAWGNLVAGEHTDSTEALALLAYLEDRVGQTERSLSTLRRAREQNPEDIALLGATAEILIDRLNTSEAIRLLDGWIANHPPHGDVYRLRARAAAAAGDAGGAILWRSRSAQAYADESKPELARRGPAEPVANDSEANGPASSAPPPPITLGWPAPGFEPLPMLAEARTVTGNGLVIDQGRRVVTHARVVAGAADGILVRNGLGKIRRARLESLRAGQGIAVLRLQTPYPAAWSVAQKRHAAPDGVRFCFVLGFPVVDGTGAAYPTITPGIVVRANTGLAGLMQITGALGPDHSGSPVFDNLGRLIGIALGKGDTVNGVTDLKAQLGAGSFAIRADALAHSLPHRDRPSRKNPVPQPGAPSAEELYEQLLPAVVAIVVPH